ncbi:MAG: hypothetical protein ACXVJX_08195 [Acidimicrobiia bacterium]
MTAVERRGDDRRVRDHGTAPAIVALLLLGVVVPLWITSHYGALGIPRSDDWSYSVTLFRLVDSGRLSFNHWVSMNLVGQLALAAPVAWLRPHGLGALQVFTACAGGVALVAVFATARRVGADTLTQFVVAASIAACPLWGPLAISFMTDVPTLALSGLATLLAVAAWTRRPVSTRMLIASVVVGVAAFTVRQYALIPVIAILVVAIATTAPSGDRAGLRRWIGVALVVALGVVLFTVWWRQVPDGRALSPAVPTAATVRRTVLDGAGFLRLLGLLTLPVLLLTDPIARVRRSWAAHPVIGTLVGGGTAVWLAGSELRAPSTVFVGNYLTPQGALADIVLVGHRPDVLPHALWLGVVLVASVAAVLLAVAAVPPVLAVARRVAARDLTVTDPIRLYFGLSIAGYLGVYLVAIVTGLQVYDRYVLPVAVLVALGLALPAAASAPTPAGRSGRGAVAAAGIALTGLAVLGLAFTADSASYDGGRWRVATAAVRAGWPARTVNGGFEWLDYHRRDRYPVRVGPDGRPVRPVICVSVHSDPRRPPGRVVAVATASAPTRPTIRFVAFRTTTPCAGVRRQRAAGATDRERTP